MARRRNLRRLLFLGHRYLGVGCALFVVMLAVTGLMLNHTEKLKMDERHVQSATLLSWYGIKTPTLGNSFRVGDRWLSEFGGKLYFDGEVVADSELPLIGASVLEEFYIAAYPSELILLTSAGEVIERINTTYGLTHEIQQVGFDTEKMLPVIRTSSDIFIGDQNLFEWSSYSVNSVTWINAEKSPIFLEEEIIASYRGEGLTLERVVLDLHSGRIAGSYGVFFMDVVAVLFLVLAGVGVWMWARR